MVATTVYTQADLDAIDRAIARGVLSVNYIGLGNVTYRSLADMQAQRRLVANQINLAAGVTPTRRIKLVTTKDL